MVGPGSLFDCEHGVIRAALYALHGVVGRHELDRHQTAIAATEKPSQ